MESIKNDNNKTLGYIVRQSYGYLALDSNKQDLGLWETYFKAEIAIRRNASKPPPHICPICEDLTTDINGSGTCNECEQQGFWVDPAGGTHYGDDDPAAMYE